MALFILGEMEMEFHSLRTRFIFLFLAFFVIPFALITYFSVSMSREMAKKNTISHLESLVELKSKAIEQWMKERIGDGKAIAESQEIKSLNPGKFEPYFKFVRNFYQAYQEISVFDLKGQRVGGFPPGPSAEHEEWFHGAVKKGLFVSSPILQTPHNQPITIIAVVIKDEADRPLGALKEIVNLSYISELILEAKIGKTGEVFLVSPQGKFLFHKFLKELADKGLDKVPYFESLQTNLNSTFIYMDYKNNEVLGTKKWIPSLQCYLIAEQDAEEAFSGSDSLVRRASVIFIVSILIILTISYFIVEAVIKPIKLLNESAASFAKGEFKSTLAPGRKDEIGMLISGFNGMAEKLKKAYADLEGKVQATNKELETAYQVLKQRQEQMIRSEKLAALGQLSAGIAHEIRTPLTSIKIFIQSLEKRIQLDEVQKNDFRLIRREIDRINENINRFLNFARPEDPLFQEVDINLLIRETINLLAAEIRASTVNLKTALLDPLPPIEGDPKQLSQVFLNLIVNALEAMPGGGTLSIQSAMKFSPDISASALQIFFQDTGYGIPEKDRPYLFDPFFTTKEAGTGLGLSIVYSIIQKNNGQIEVESEIGRGTTFILSFPIQEGEWKKSQ